MKEVVKEAGLQSDGELVQARADVFGFVAPRAPVGLILPAVQMAREAAAVDQSDRDGTAGARVDWDAHGDWIEILTMSPPPPTRATQSGGDDDDDDGLPPTVVWDLGNAGGYDDGLPPTLDWDLG